jgi:hypothetical protein
MAMTQATLSTQLQNMTPTGAEATAITNLVNAYGTYAAGAASNGVPIQAAGVNLGKAAMQAALVGMSGANQGITKIPASIVQFWIAVAGGLATSFAGAIAIVPPPNAGLAALLAATFPANVSGNKTLVQACNAIAADMHVQAIIGGTVTFAGPIGPFPIL